MARISNMEELQAFDRLALALKGCPRCAYDEAEGGLVDHCDKCCRKVTGAAWWFMRFATKKPRKARTA